MEGFENYSTQSSATSSGAYENYDSNDALSPYQMLMQMKAWNKAIYLRVEDVDAQTKSQLSVLSDRITAEVHDLNQDLVSYVDQTASAITSEVTDFKNQTQAQFQVQAGQISSKVASADYNGNTIASLINQTATTVAIDASRINLTGYVTISSLGVNGTTTIHGNRIQTGTLSADRIIANSITGNQIAFNTITGNNISAGAISAGHISAYSITGDKLAFNTITGNQIASGAISAGHIQSYSITAGLIASGAIQAHHIQAGAITADMISTGYLSANRISGGTLSGVNLDLSTDAVIGRYLYLGATRNGTSIDGRAGYFDVEASTRCMFNTYTFSVNATYAYLNGKRILTTDDLT